MTPLANFLQSLRRDERGLTTVEYVIALCLVGAVGVGLWSSFGQNIRSQVRSADRVINEAAGEAIKLGGQGSDADGA